VVGLCLRDQKQLEKAVAALDDVARVPVNRTSGLGAGDEAGRHDPQTCAVRGRNSTILTCALDFGKMLR
jgi:hypothetical protein